MRDPSQEPHPGRAPLSLDLAAKHLEKIRSQTEKTDDSTHLLIRELAGLVFRVGQAIVDVGSSEKKEPAQIRQGKF